MQVAERSHIHLNSGEYRYSVLNLSWHEKSAILKSSLVNELHSLYCNHNLFSGTRTKNTRSTPDVLLPRSYTIGIRQLYSGVKSSHNKIPHTIFHPNHCCGQSWAFHWLLHIIIINIFLLLIISAFLLSAPKQVSCSSTRLSTLYMYWTRPWRAWINWTLTVFFPWVDDSKTRAYI